jgi:hypothetical protein
MALNWTGIWNRLWRIIDSPGNCYFSGPRFLRTVTEVSLDLPAYGELMESRRTAGRSTSRKDYFRDVLMDLEETIRIRAVSAILKQVESSADPNLTSQIRDLMGGGTVGPSGEIPAEAWNAERLNRLLSQIDEAIAASEYGRAVTLSYTSLEGFCGAFVRSKVQGQSLPNELIALSRLIRDHLKQSIPEYPDEVLNLINHSSHAVDKARNRFSESHFAGEAGRWLAIYVRDLVNTQIRLLLHFM